MLLYIQTSTDNSAYSKEKMKTYFEEAKEQYLTAKEVGLLDPESQLRWYLSNGKINKYQFQEILNSKREIEDPSEEEFEDLEKEDLNNTKNLEQFIPDKKPLFGPKKKIKLVGIKNLPPKQYIIKRFEIERGTLTNICASGCSGKSFLIQYFACCLSSGKMIFDQFEVPKGKVLHIDQEQSEIQTQRRYERIAAWMELEELDIDRIVLSSRINPEQIIESEKEVEQIFSGYDMVIIDSLKAISQVDENHPNADAVPKMLKRIAEKTNSAVLLIHHKGKSDSGAKQSSRGHSGIYDSCDNQIDINHDVNSPSYELDCRKVRDGRPFDGIKYDLIDEGEFVEDQNCTSLLKFQLTDAELKPVKSEQKMKILQILKDQGKKNLTELFDLVGGDRNTFRKGLEHLVDDGSVLESKGTKNARIFEITESGQWAGLEK